MSTAKERWTARTKTGPKPQFTAAADICFTPEQLARVTRVASRRRISRNAVVRAAVDAYLVTCVEID